MLASVLNTFLPMRCAMCGQTLIGAEHGVCAKCTQGLQPVLEGNLLHLGAYGGKLERAVRALKFAQTRVVAVPLGQRLAQATIEAGWRSDVVVPVPLHISRARQRGYNQAAVLAKAVAQTLHVPMQMSLQRVRATQQQARLAKKDRVANLEDAFTTIGHVRGLEILLIDDVHTSGTTMTEASLALIDAGAKRVRLAVLARA